MKENKLEGEDEQVERLLSNLRIPSGPGENAYMQKDRLAAADLIESQARQIATITAERDALAGAMSADMADVALSYAAAAAERDRAVEALYGLVWIIDKAGLLNLSNGVQLGQNSWYAKASRKLDAARAVLAASPTLTEDKTA